MRQHRGDESLAVTVAALFFDNEDIGEPGESGEIRDDARKTDLLTVEVNPETKRIFQRAVKNVRCDFLRPVTAVAQKIVMSARSSRARSSEMSNPFSLSSYGFIKQKAPPVLPAGLENFQND